MAPVLTLFFTFPFLFNAPKQHLLLLIHHPQTTSTFCRIHPSLPLPQPTLDLQDHVCLCSPAPWFPALRLLLATVSHLFPDYRVWFAKQLGPFLAVCTFFFKAKDFLGCPVLFQSWQRGMECGNCALQFVYALMPCNPVFLISKTSTTARKFCFTDDLTLPFLVSKGIISKISFILSTSIGLMGLN